MALSREQIQALSHQLAQVDAKEEATINRLFRELTRVRAELRRLIQAGAERDELALLMGDVERLIRQFREFSQRTVFPAVEFALDSAGALVISNSTVTAQIVAQIINTARADARERIGQALRDIEAKTLQKIRTVLLDLMSGSLDVGRAIKKIGVDVLTKPGTGAVFRPAMARAEAIVRTEVSGALNRAAAEYTRELGRRNPDLLKFWLHTDDNRTRESHIRTGRKTNPSYGGKAIPWNDMFRVGSSRAFGPHDPGLPAKEIVHCRCTLVTIDAGI